MHPAVGSEASKSVFGTGAVSTVAAKVEHTYPRAVNLSSLKACFFDARLRPGLMPEGHSKRSPGVLAYAACSRLVTCDWLSPAYAQRATSRYFPFISSPFKSVQVHSSPFKFVQVPSSPLQLGSALMVIILH